MKSIFANPDKGAGWINAGESVLDLIKKVPALALLSINIFLKFSKLFISMMIGRLQGIIRGKGMSKDKKVLL